DFDIDGLVGKIRVPDRKLFRLQLQVILGDWRESRDTFDIPLLKGNHNHFIQSAANDTLKTHFLHPPFSLVNNLVIDEYFDVEKSLEKVQSSIRESQTLEHNLIQQRNQLRETLIEKGETIQVKLLSNITKQQNELNQNIIELEILLLSFKGLN